MHIRFLIILLLLSTACKSQDLINPAGNTIESRIKTPEGYTRIKAESGSYAEYLRNMPLRPDGTAVYLYNGNRKSRNVHVAVLDIEIGKKDLLQCADAAMLLRATYLYNRKDYNKIAFRFTNGFKTDFVSWAKGKRIKVTGNKVVWIGTASDTPDYSYKNFRKYMEVVFMYAGTLSLANELKSVKIEDMKIGDILIQGGSPGHAVTVTDMAEDKSGNRIYLLAQSYMPAQDIHVIKNPGSSISPWYKIKTSGKIETAEWPFTINDLKRFEI